MQDREVAVVVSVEELVGHRLHENDRWNLALVQRDEVWDEVRMRHLLDSLLAGYPIGAILLCRVKEASRVLRVDGMTRELQDAKEGAWQLLDGQQRINALFSIFTDQGAYGRFYLDMTKERQSPGPSQARAAKERAMPYIVHCDRSDDTPPNREDFIDLSRWAGWAKAQSELDPARVSASSVLRILHDLDPEFAPAREPEQAATAAQRLQQLMRLWTSKTVPVLRTEVASPLDVLEVFTRINLGGVNVLGTDVYFAGVKTFWAAAGVNAEQRLDALVSAAPFLNSRLQGLRFLSRLASRGLGRGDLLPLTVDRLAGDRGALLLTAMDELTSHGSTVMMRLESFSCWYSEHSDLGYALRLVTHELWDDVLAWVAASARDDVEWFELNKALIDSYLLGATMFDYRSVLGSQFHRLAMLEALTAGSNGEEFPTGSILAVAEAKTSRQGSRGRRPLSLEGDDRDRLAGSRGTILTALAQRIPYEWEAEEKFDWDHIFPKAEAHRMWAPGAGRRRHHADRSLINSSGNFWALHLGANRSLGRTVGTRKFELLRRWASDPAKKFAVWPLERWSISDSEIQNFIEVDRLLTDDPDSVERGMELFRQTVTGRAERLLSEALARFPLAAQFAGGSRVAGHDASDGRRDFRMALAIQSNDDRLRHVNGTEARAIVRQRAHVLSALVADRLRADANLRTEWIYVPSGARSLVAFELADGNCIELILEWTPADGARLSVKAYPKRGAWANLYLTFDHVPLGLGWQDEDSAIVTGFLQEVRRLDLEHGRR